MEKKRYANIDLLKAIAIIMVISLHAGLFHTTLIETNATISMNVAIQYALRIIAEGVPIFILVNGFLLINKENFDLKAHLKKTLKVFLLLILWSVILTVCIKLIWQENLTIKGVLENVLTTGINNPYTGILWFLQSLITLYLIYPILKNLHDTNKTIYNYLFIVLFIGTTFINALDLVGGIVKWQTNFDGIYKLTSYMNKFQIVTNRNFLIFFMLGGYLFERKEKLQDRKIRIKWFMIGMIAWLVAFLYAYGMSKLQGKTYPNNYAYESIFMLCFLIAWFAITYTYQDKNKWYHKLITLVGKNSLGIYLLHIIVIRMWNVLFVGMEGILFRIIKVIAVLAISLVITLLFKKIPVVRKAINI